jgi:uncharacterized protein YjbJ (UPF0337 family)
MDCRLAERPTFDANQLTGSKPITGLALAWRRWPRAGSTASAPATNAGPQAQRPSPGTGSAAHSDPQASSRKEARTMDKNRTDGAKREVKGAMKQFMGKITGNASKEKAGSVERQLGEVQKSAGEAADEIRDAAKKP